MRAGKSFQFLRVEIIESARRHAPSVTSQSINSVSSLVISVLVAHLLGPSAFGAFTFVFTLLLLFGALQTSWVGDGLAVLDRTDPALRLGLGNSQWGHMVIGSLIGVIAATLFAQISAPSALLFGLLIFAWEAREFSRRTFMARVELGRLAIADGIYMLVTLATIGSLAVTDHLTLASVLGAMCAGTLCSIAVSHLLTAGHERLRLPVLSFEGMMVVAQFGFWRGAQTAIGYASQVGAQALVIAAASAAVMGEIAAGRILVAPLFTLILAVMSMTLVSVARAAREGRPLPKPTESLWLWTISFLFIGLISLALAEPLTRLVVGDEFDVNRLAIFGWITFALATALNIPSTALVLALGGSRTVFNSRLLAAVLSIGLTIVAVLFGSYSVMPLCMAAGMLLSAVMLTGAAKRFKMSYDRDTTKPTELIGR
jgi:O-antigen/teichoic acid export membrane protein